MELQWVGRADAKGVPGIKVQAQVCRAHLPMAWAGPLMLEAASRRQQRVWAETVGCPEGMQMDVGLEMEMDMERKERWDQQRNKKAARKRVYLEENSPILPWECLFSSICC